MKSALNLCEKLWTTSCRLQRELFLRQQFGTKIAKGLNGFVFPDHQVIHLKERFQANTDDVVWMQQIAQEEDWIIVTADVRIGKNPQEVEAWKQAGHTIFFLKARLDGYEVLGSGAEIHEMFSINN